MCREIIFFCAELLNYWSMTFFGLKLFAKVYGFSVHKNKIVENALYASMCLPISLFAAGNYYYVIYSTLLTYIFIVYMFIIIKIICRDNKKRFIYIVAIYFFVMRLLDLWIVAVICEVSNISRFVEVDIIHFGYDRVAYMISLFFVYYLIYCYARRKDRFLYYLKDNRLYCWIISMYSMLGNGCFNRVYLMNNKEKIIEYWILYLICAFAFSGSFLFYIIKSKNDEKTKILNMRNDMLEANYKGLQKAYMINSTLQHDHKNHMLAVSHLIKENKKEEALSYINTYIDFSKNLYNDIKSGNNIIDIIVNSKIIETKEKNINFVYEIDFLDRVEVEDMDMCALLANLLENAVDACEKIDIYNREISLKIFKRNGMIFIQIANSIHPYVVKKKKIFETEKKDSQLHGWGMRSIEHVVNKYGGTKEYYLEDNRIEIFITIPN